MRIVRILSTSVLILSLLAGPAGARASEPMFSQVPYQLQVSPAEARATLNAYLRFLELRSIVGEQPDSKAIGQVSRLLRSYRSSRVWETNPLKDAPYPGAIIYGQASSIWSGLYQSQYQSAYKDNVVDVKLETLFDAFLDLYVRDQLPPEMRAAGDAIGKCLARKVLRGANPQQCPLDNSTKVKKVSVFQQLWAKTTCGLDTPPPCFARKVVFDAAKPDLIKFRTDPAVQQLVAAEFSRQFPQLFREEFIKEMGTRMSGFPRLINDKFKGEFNPMLWGPSTALFETLEDPREPHTDEWSPQPNRKVTLKGFAAGLRADLGVANLFADRESKYLRGIAAPMFYASANRLLMLTGGTRASWTGSRFEMMPEGPARELKLSPLPDLARRLDDGGAGEPVFVAGRKAKLAIEALDANRGRVSAFAGKVQVRMVSLNASGASAPVATAVTKLPAEAAFDASDKGAKLLELTLPAAGEYEFIVSNSAQVLSGRAKITVLPAVDLATVIVSEPVFVPAPPVFKPQRYGGWSSVTASPGTTYEPWDWATYDPLTPGNPIRIFPSELLAGPSGVPMRPAGAVEAGLIPAQDYEDIDSMASMLISVADFLKYTRPGAPLSGHLGDASQVQDVLDAGKPMIFPKEGRMLAVGLIAGVLKNFVAVGGHLEQIAPASDPEWPLGIALFDQLSASGRQKNKVSVQAVARLLIAAARLQWELESDPDVPKELKDLLPQLGDVVRIGGFTLGAKGQEPDGGFREHMGVAQAGGRQLRNTILSLRALTYAFQLSNMLAVMVRVKNGWDYIDKAWGEDDIPKFEDGPSAPPVSPSELWELVNLWEETGVVLKSHPHTAQMDWGKWERRFENLTTLLKNQLNTDHGPVGLSH